MNPVIVARTDDRTLYQPPADPVLVEVPSFEFVMIDGSGDPGTSPDYQAAVAALYAVSYPVVITLKRAGRPGLKVRPLEGLWWAEDLSVFQPAGEDRASWRWTMMIRQPDDVPGEVYDAAAAKMDGRVSRPRRAGFLSAPAAATTTTAASCGSTAAPSRPSWGPSAP